MLFSLNAAFPSGSPDLRASFKSGCAAGQLTLAPERCFRARSGHARMCGVTQREVKTVHCNRNPIGMAGKTL
jgi:hypothetical protein